MSGFDLKNNIKVDLTIDPQEISTNTTVSGNPIDLRGFNSVTFIGAAAVADGNFEPLVLESDDGVSFTAVADDQLIGVEDDEIMSNTKTTFSIGYIGGKSFAKCSIVSTAVTVGGNVCVQAVLGHPGSAPVA